jgi:hypothetical protein
MTRIPLPVELYDPATGETLFLFKVGSVEGRGTFAAGGGDIINVRNFQFGFIGNGVSSGGDLSSGGGGASDAPRMPLGVAYDNGGTTTIFDGRHNPLMQFRGAATKANDRVRLYVPLQVYQNGAWRNVKLATA